MSKLNKFTKICTLLMTMSLGLTMVSANTVTTMSGYFHDSSKSYVSNGENIGTLTIKSNENGTIKITDPVKEYDVNGDGKVDSSDAIYLLSAYQKPSAYPIPYFNLDSTYVILLPGEPIVEGDFASSSLITEEILASVE